MTLKNIGDITGIIQILYFFYNIHVQSNEIQENTDKYNVYQSKQVMGQMTLQHNF